MYSSRSQHVLPSDRIMILSEFNAVTSQNTMSEFNTVYPEYDLLDRQHGTSRVCRVAFWKERGTSRACTVLPSEGSTVYPEYYRVAKRQHGHIQNDTVLRQLRYISEYWICTEVANWQYIQNMDRCRSCNTVTSRIWSVRRKQVLPTDRSFDRRHTLVRTRTLPSVRCHILVHTSIRSVRRIIHWMYPGCDLSEVNIGTSGRTVICLLKATSVHPGYDRVRSQHVLRTSVWSVEGNTVHPEYDLSDVNTCCLLTDYILSECNTVRPEYDLSDRSYSGMQHVFATSVYPESWFVWMQHVLTSDRVMILSECTRVAFWQIMIRRNAIPCTSRIWSDRRHTQVCTSVCLLTVRILSVCNTCWHSDILFVLEGQHVLPSDRIMILSEGNSCFLLTEYEMSGCNTCCLLTDHILDILCCLQTDRILDVHVLHQDRSFWMYRVAFWQIIFWHTPCCHLTESWSGCSALLATRHHTLDVTWCLSDRSYSWIYRVELWHRVQRCNRDKFWQIIFWMYRVRLLENHILDVPFWYLTDHILGISCCLKTGSHSLCTVLLSDRTMTSSESNNVYVQSLIWQKAYPGYIQSMLCQKASYSIQ